MHTQESTERTQVTSQLPVFFCVCWSSQCRSSKNQISGEGPFALFSSSTSSSSSSSSAAATAASATCSLASAAAAAAEDCSAIQNKAALIAIIECITRIRQKPWTKAPSTAACIALHNGEEKTQRNPFIASALVFSPAQFLKKLVFRQLGRRLQ